MENIDACGVKNRDIVCSVLIYVLRQGFQGIGSLSLGVFAMHAPTSRCIFSCNTSVDSMTVVGKIKASSELRCKSLNFYSIPFE